MFVLDGRGHKCLGLGRSYLRTVAYSWLGLPELPLAAEVLPEIVWPG
jgi:hypothetical protein